MRAEALCGGEGEPGHHADGFIEDRAQSAVHLLHACGGERTITDRPLSAELGEQAQSHGVRVICTDVR